MFPTIPKRVCLTLAGHTHGGQVALPLIGRPIVPSHYGEDYAIGHIHEAERDLFVTSGVGTSIIPVRFRVPAGNCISAITPGEMMMKLSEMLLAQLERETAATRKMVERVPEGKSDWKPHPKSMQMGYLSALVATMFGWIATMIDQDHLDLAAGSGASASTGWSVWRCSTNRCRTRDALCRTPPMSTS